MSLKALREAAGLSQGELGRLLADALNSPSQPQYHQPRISSYESGRNNMPLPVAAALVTVLNEQLKVAKPKTKLRATLEQLLDPEA